MSVLFPKVNKPREWDYRPIYYDEEKEARKEKLARLRQEHTLHRGSFREEHEKNMTELRRKKQSKLVFWIVLLVMLLFVFYYLL
ncbi:MAG: hypothetical protein MJZ92_04390 [Paludibacteraceae bacterium]|nr:hypothetical protein [Paludibacteraceae bacterium]